MNKTGFKKLEEEYNQLWMEGKKEEALAKVKMAAEEYPEEEYTTYLDQAVLNLELGNKEEVKKILSLTQEKGYWYPGPYIEPIFGEDDFQEIIDKWDELRNKYEAAVKAQYLLFTPENYNPDKKYPLFLAFHGWGESAKFFADYWKSSRIKKDFILILPQSSQIIGTHNFCWNDEEAAHQEIEEMLKEIKTEYLIDEKKIIVGGFSQGGGLTIDTVLNQDYLSCRGFITLCPSKPENFSDEKVKTAAEREIKGVILTGEHDQDLPQQIEMIRKFEEYKLPCQLIIKEGLGHWFPDDLEEQLDQALAFIME